MATEVEDDTFDMEGMEEEDGVDAIEYLGALLQTSEGETIADVLAGLSKHLENQNKILIKIFSVLSKPT